MVCSVCVGPLRCLSVLPGMAVVLSFDQAVIGTVQGMIGGWVGG